jgi:hypothetical protein
MSTETKVVATGTWYYDRAVPKRITIYAKAARFAGSRYDDDDQLDDTRPIPDTPDGLVYFCSPGGGEGRTLTEAKAWADSQPWGPVRWD